MLLNDEAVNVTIYIYVQILTLLTISTTNRTRCRSIQSNYIEITLRHGCSPVNLRHILRTPFPTNTSQRRIQTTSTSASAQVISTVLKLLKNTGIPVFSYKLFYSFLRPIKKVRTSSVKVCRSYSAKSFEGLCMPAMR